MIRFLLSDRLPANRLLRSRCLADPDALAMIAARVQQTSQGLKDPADDFSIVLHDLRMGGVWKRTGRGRLARSQEILCSYIGEPRDGCATFLEVGASDGVTTVEATQALRESLRCEVQSFLTDRNIWLLRFRVGPFVEYRATDSEPILMRVGPIGIVLAKQRRGRRPDRNVLAQLYLRSRRFRSSMKLDSRISLVHPRAVCAAGIQIRELDCLVFDPFFEGRLNAIRASNVLNLGYFSPDQICCAVRHFHTYLQDQGCLIISRSEGEPGEEKENGSVWRKERHRLRWLMDFGSGSEIKTVLNALLDGPA